jgi:hypothetical protein
LDTIFNKVARSGEINTIMLSGDSGNENYDLLFDFADKNVLIECPWPNLIDLKGQKLKPIEKWYLGQQLDSRLITAKELHRMYNLNVRTLNCYRKQFRCRLVTCMNKGRPRALSKNILHGIVNTLRTEPMMTEAKLRKIIRERFRKFWGLFQDNRCASIQRTLSMRSIVRYSKLIRNNAALLQTTNASHNINVTQYNRQPTDFVEENASIMNNSISNCTLS